MVEIEYKTTQEVADILKTKLKNARLARAEDLTEETRKKYNLPESGLIVIETNEVPVSSDFEKQWLSRSVFEEWAKQLAEKMEAAQIGSHMGDLGLVIEVQEELERVGGITTA